jgi:hypothetical protein
MKYIITAVTSIAIDISHIHPDLKNPFRRSNTTTTHIIMAATVLICKSTPSFKEASQAFLLRLPEAY